MSVGALLQRMAEIQSKYVQLEHDIAEEFAAGYEQSDPYRHLLTTGGPVTEAERTLLVRAARLKDEAEEVLHSVQALGVVGVF